MPHPSPLKSHIGYRLRVVSNAVSHSFARKLEETGVTVAEWVILRDMFEIGVPVAPSRIADRTGLTRGTISKLVDRLAEKDLILRKESRGDRRYQAVELTSVASRLVPKLAAIADENDEYFFSGLSASERTNLTKTLMKLAELHELRTTPTE
jgi:DNA-binding MarR family transcriptional regulator